MATKTKAPKKLTGKRPTNAKRAPRKVSAKRNTHHAVATRPAASDEGQHYCSMPQMPERALPAEIDPMRASLIRLMSQKWTNGTQLHYYFFDRQSDGEEVVLSDGTRHWVSWIGDAAQRDAVRSAFDAWKSVGMGLEFIEVDKREDAEIRIGFMQGDGAWSYLGRHVLNIATNKRTMNFGWDISNDIDTAIHEIGHTLGFPHEHQNPLAGIDWNEEQVYQTLARPPNNWSRETTFHNILRKIPGDTVQGSSWDPDSIMHYPFKAEMISGPTPFNAQGITPAAGLSQRDVSWVQQFYPSLQPQNDPELTPFESIELHLSEGEQRNFVIEPESTRYYKIQTFGVSDTVMALFEDEGGDLRYVTADDDSGHATNASLRIRLFAGRRFILRIRLYWADATGQTAVMLW
ncbi:MAG: M12 family metallopeptidase [Congregibacter sp.]